MTSFTIKLVGLIAQEDEAFQQWKGKDVFNQLCTIFRLREKDLPASVKMAYTSMLCHIIKHPAGRQWVKESGTLFSKNLKTKHNHFVILI